MNVTENGQVLQARKILVIKDTRLRLLQLPRELRDNIWRRVLTEPMKWVKRHATNCVHFDKQAQNPPPPYRTSVLRDEFAGLNIGPFLWKPEEQDMSDEERRRRWTERTAECFIKCIQRKGLGLLRVCRQVHSETMPFLWESTTFCFEQPHLFLDYYTGYTPPQAWSITKLCLLAPKRWGYVWGNGDEIETLIHIVNDLKCLVQLELCFSLFGGILWYTCVPAGLRYLSVAESRTLRYTPPARTVQHRVQVDVLLSHEFDLAAGSPRPCERHRGLMPGRRSCLNCSSRLIDVYDEAYDFFRDSPDTWRDARTISGQVWYAEVEKNLSSPQQQRYVRQRSDDLSFFVPITMRSGRRKQVKILGVERIYTGVRQRRHAQSHQSRQELIKRQDLYKSTLPKACIDEEEGELPISYGRGLRHWRNQAKRQADHTAEKVRKREHQRDVETRQESARLKSASKKEAKERRKAESEIQVEKKIGRSRLGKKRLGKL